MRVSDDRKGKQMIRSVILAFASAVALAVPCVAAAEPSPTRVSVAPHATYVSAQQVNVKTTIACSEGMSYFASASLVQPSGMFTQVFGFGSVSGQCTGRHQDVAVPVVTWFFPGWQLGNALASVSACAFVCDSAAREIRITL
jgi:hypothetical protein